MGRLRFTVHIAPAQLCRVRIAKPGKTAEAGHIADSSRHRTVIGEFKMKEACKLFPSQINNLFAVQPLKTRAALEVSQAGITAVGSSPTQEPAQKAGVPGGRSIKAPFLCLQAGNGPGEARLAKSLRR